MENRLLQAARKQRGIGVVLLAFAVILGCGCAPKGKASAAPYDLQFIDTMTAHHEAAMAMARVVAGKAMHAEVRDIAQLMFDVQSAEVTQMAMWRDAWFPRKPKAVNMELPGMAESMKDMDTSHLSTLAGEELDMMFIDMMIPHHQGAVAMAQDALQKAQHPEIKTLAQQIIDAQQVEIETMNRWREERKPAM